MPKEQRSKPPSKTIPKISSAEQEHEWVVLKPVARPEISKIVPTKKKEIAPTTKLIEESVAAKPLVIAARGDQKEPEELTKAKISSAENDEVEKISCSLSKNQYRSEKGEKPSKEDVTTIQVKKTEKSPKEVAKSLIIKKGKHILKECKEKEDISLKPVECIQKDAALEKISSKIEKPKDEKPPLTTVTKAKLSPKAAELKKGEEVKKTVSPKVEPSPLRRKSSAIAGKTISPKELKQVTVTSEQNITSQEHPGHFLPLMKELSPEVVQLQKIPTQQEEVILEEFEGKKGEDEEGEEEEETWGLEVSYEGYEAEEFDSNLEDEAIETPRGTGDKIGEREF